MDSITKNNLLLHPGIFNAVADQYRMCGTSLKPGRYQVKKGESLLNIVRMLRNNQQTSVNLVINKLRTKEDLARIIGKNFEADSIDVMDVFT